MRVETAGIPEFARFVYLVWLSVGVCAYAAVHHLSDLHASMKLYASMLSDAAWLLTHVKFQQDS